MPGFLLQPSLQRTGLRLLEVGIHHFEDSGAVFGGDFFQQFKAVEHFTVLDHHRGSAHQKIQRHFEGFGNFCGNLHRGLHVVPFVAADDGPGGAHALAELFPRKVFVLTNLCHIAAKIYRHTYQKALILRAIGKCMAMMGAKQLVRVLLVWYRCFTFVTDT